MPSSTSSSRHCKDSIHLLIESCFFYNHRDDVPVDIYTVIIDNVLNGSEVYGSGRRLARAMLPISGGMCTSSTQLFSTATTTGRCSTRSAPPRPPTHLVATMPRRTSCMTHYGHKDVGADLLRHIRNDATGTSPSLLLLRLHPAP